MEKSRTKDIKRYPCLCCGYLTRGYEFHGSYDPCSVCGWCDDHIQAEDHDRTGCSNKMSLNQAKANYAEFGAKSRQALEWVRKPRPEEMPEP